jgi:dihydropyrimidinase
MLDIVIHGGQVVTPSGTGIWDVGIQGERIASIAAPGSLTEDAARTIDASGSVVVPGGIDPHMHCKWNIPSPGGGPPGYSAGPEVVSRAALFGGTTTLIDFAPWTTGKTIEQAIEERQQDWRDQCHCDYALHVMLLGSIDPPVFDQIPDAIAAGYPSFKLFTTDITPSRKGRKVLFGDIWEVLQRTARHGGIAVIHAEDDDIVMHQYDKLIREGRTGFPLLPEVHNSLSEDLAFRRVIRLAEHVDGAALYMMHVSAATGVAAVAEARADGYPIYGETLHQYALFTAEAYLRPNGQIYHTYPSLKRDQDCRALWDGMRNGAIKTVATDGICTSLEVKIQGRRIDDTTGGNAGVEPRMGVIYSESVVQRHFSLEHFVDLTSANAARLLGLYPRKGAIAPGSDADIVLIDPTPRGPLQKEDLHETDYSPWENWPIAGWPVVTIRRGKVVVEDGRLNSAPSEGKWLPRKVDGRVLSGPM